MSATPKTLRYCYQDGDTFYTFSDMDHTADFQAFTYPGKVLDFDMDAARKAREWFMQHCAERNVQPIWEETP